MKRFNKTLALALSSLALMTGNAPALITFDYVVVGNPNPATPDPTTGYGAVGYSYAISKYEVTLSQYATFLNSVAKTDAYGLYNANIGTDRNVRGISTIA